MTEENNGLKQRKSKDKKKNESKRQTEENSNDETKDGGGKKSKGPAPMTAKDIRTLTEEHRNEMGKKMFKRSVRRIGLICVAFIVIYFYSWFKSEETFKPFVTTKDQIIDVPFVKQVPCSNDYESDRKKFPKCAPALCDLHSGALSYGKKFVNVFALLKNQNKKEYFNQAEFNVYRQVKNKIHQYITKQFKIPVDSLYLTSPTFFSKLSGQPAQSVHDQYWHTHIDKKTYKSFHYTSLLYLNTYYHEFNGGRFVFADKAANYSVEPKQSRVLAFTSGSENPHFVEQVDKGVRYAITISFTCDQQLAIDDPHLLN